MTEKIDKKNDDLFPFQTYTFRNTTELEMMCPSAFDLMLNPEHEHELWIGNINGLVSPTSEYGLAIKLKGYIIAGKKLTFILPENYEAIRPDNGNIGFRKTVLDMIHLGESRKQITIFTYSIDHAEDDINKKILKKFSEAEMKFDVAILNPPYDGNLHLRILEQVIPIANTVVNISPIRWLQDPLANYKQGTAYKKFEETISKKINSIDIISHEKATVIFNALFSQDLGIYVIDKNNKCYYNYKDIPFIEKSKSIFSKVIKNVIEKNIKSVCEINKFDGIRVKIQEIKNAAPSSNNLTGIKVYDDTKNPARYDLMYRNFSSVFNNGYGLDNTNKWWSEYGNKNKYTKAVGEPMPFSIKFDTIVEAKNFENSCFTKFFKYCMFLMKLDQHVPLSFLPYMQDYTQPWDDKRFCEYFGITGYIDDDHAETGSEWETILKTMEQYK